MIRPAKYSDIPAIMELLRRAHARSKYANIMGLSDKAMDQMLTGLVAGQNQNGPGASFIQVAETKDKVTGFMAGSLSRIYNIGEKLGAADLFLVNEGKSLKDVHLLLDSYIDWAASNPKVIEIGLSCSDALPHGKDVQSIYRRKGAILTGHQFTIQRPAALVRMAA